MSKKVLVTGSTNGIGKVIATTLSENGYDVFITGRNEKALNKIAENFNINKFVTCDLLKQNASKELYEEAERQLGHVDILINNAGEYFYGAIDKTSREDIERLLILNTKVPYELISLVVKNMKINKFGRIVNIGSISGTVGEANASLYSMTKSAFSGMTKALALELAQYNITVNTINPGYVRTHLLENSFDDDFTEDELLDIIPQNRFIEPVEIANLVRYMISEEAKGLTGQSVNLCAGMSVGG